MDKLTNWLFEEKKDNTSIALFILSLIVLKFSYYFFVAKLLVALELNISPLTTNLVVSSSLFLTFIFVFFVVLVNEILFRLIPISSFINAWGTSPKTIIGTLIISLVYGIICGGIGGIIFQGVGGFLYSATFLKCGGGQKKYMKALIATVIFGILSEYTLMFPLLF